MNRLSISFKWTSYICCCFFNQDTRPRGFLLVQGATSPSHGEPNKLLPQPVGSEAKQQCPPWKAFGAVIVLLFNGKMTPVFDKNHRYYKISWSLQQQLGSQSLPLHLFVLFTLKGLLVAFASSRFDSSQLNGSWLRFQLWNLSNSASLHLFLSVHSNGQRPPLDKQ